MVDQIDFNCDMGESFGVYKLGFDEQVIKHISSANIACGYHAGDPSWMAKTVLLAQQNNVAIGAHPSYPDLNGFGRRNMNLSTQEVKDIILYQVGALNAFTGKNKLQHIKPHGALYNQAVDDTVLAKSICEVIFEYDSNIILLALAGSKWIKMANSMGLRVASEVFADRAINKDGSLVSRSIPGSVIHDTNQVVERSLRMITEGTIESVTGDIVEVEADSICLHGDTPGAVEMAITLNREFQKHGIAIVPLSEIV